MSTPSADNASETRPRPTFDEVTAISAEPDGGWTADLHPDWTVVGKPNGGYLLAILARGAAAVTAHAHPVAVSAHFMHSPDPGRAEFGVELLRSGRSTSTARARLTQDGRACVEALITTADLAPDASPFWDRGLPDPGDTAYEACTRLLPIGFDVALMNQVELRLDPASAVFATGNPSGRGRLSGWLSLPGDQPFDPVSLLLAVDTMPPATFDVAFTGWVPTVELTAYVRAVPVPGPVRITQRAQLIGDQRADQTTYVWDSAGRFVAQATQLNAIRLG